MAVDFTTAVNAYRDAASAARQAGRTGEIGGPEAASGAGFADMVKNSLDEAIATGQQAEQVSMAKIAGEASMMDVVTAVAAAEHTLETVVAVRDKVITAYQEILRMPI